MNAPPQPAVALDAPVLARPRTLGEAYAAGADNFLLLRFAAAAAVIFGHAYAMSGIPGAADFVARLNLGPGIYSGSLAVDVFFVISGFLVTGSWLQRGSLDTFARSRALRVLPAYLACLIVTAFVLGAIYTELPLRTYWTDQGTLGYVTTNAQLGTDLKFTLPGVFVHNPRPNDVNGSIWTLPAEVRMYAWVALLGFVGVLRRRWLANVAFAALLAYGLIDPEHLLLVPQAEFVRLAAFFLAGAFCYVNRDWIPLSDWLLLALAAIALLLRHSDYFLWAFGALLAYGTLWFAYRPRLGFFNRFGDYSYGLYLWGFPVEQMVAHAFGAPTRPVLIFALSFPLTLAFAVASWHWVEKPALRFKRIAR